jgi:hypothetical protein
MDVLPVDVDLGEDEESEYHAREMVIQPRLRAGHWPVASWQLKGFLIDWPMTRLQSRSLAPAVVPSTPGLATFPSRC